MGKDKILFIAYYFPPLKAVGSLRPYYFVKNMSDSHIDTMVITTGGYKNLITDSSLPTLKKTKYIFIPSFDLQMLRVFLSKIRKKKINNSNSKGSHSNNGFLFKLRNSFPLNIMYEGGFFYIFVGIILGLIHIKKTGTKKIYSTFSPYSNHMIAYFIKLFCKDCYWVADFRDLPFGDTQKDIFFKRFQQKINMIIFKKADVIVTISEGLTNKLQKYNNNIKVITNGFDELHPKERENTKEIKIVYTGLLYGGERDASLVFKSIKNLLDSNKISTNLKFIYAGTDGILWKTWANEYGLEDYIDIKGFITREEALELQKSATVNLMLTWSKKEEKGILTGKLYEYLSVQKTILCLIKGERDEEIERMFEILQCGKVVYASNEDSLREFLINIDKNKYVYNSNELLQYKYSELSKKLYEVFTNK